MSLNPDWVKLGVCSTVCPKSYLNKKNPLSILCSSWTCLDYFLDNSLQNNSLSMCEPPNKEQPQICIFEPKIHKTTIRTLTLKVLYFYKFTSYCSLKPLWSGMGEVVPARSSPTLHPPSPPTVHQLS